ncbi:Porphobilinogen deaminase [Roseimaritima multifibrata]|uniref:Porphobilinogen deaminase n=1 Tax=Roseimaritima multifibrata TaxID=1930274 RepID=A0A517M9U4_9BACT|nr:hydroxymethylbilane synthase [Roseimaritima multifibrata]QDS91660.1 Porphobilinogen deaminase [Roseimaritima multifibrata]
MHDSAPIRLATRRSPLALWQANWVADQLLQQGHRTELVLLTSRGDTDQAPIDGTRGVGFFTKRIQQALVEGEADVAVHSLKDLPTDPDERFALAAIPPRAAVGDCLISGSDHTLADLPNGSVIGTGSRRRAAQLLHMRSDLQVRPIRGNVQSRLEKLASGEFDAIILAEAGLSRLEMTQHVTERLTLEQMLPAPGQGALGIETRADNPIVTSVLASLDDRETRACVTAERTLLSHLSGGCLAPIAALATVAGDQLTLRALVLSTDGKTRLEHSAIGAIDQPNELAVEVGNQLLSQGAEPLIKEAR